VTAPTGNRWVDQDKLAATGDPSKSIANVDNIQTDLPGHSKKVKYGPMVTGDWPEGQGPKPDVQPSTSQAAGAELAQGVVGQVIPFPGEQGEEEVQDDELPELEGRKVGPAIEQARPTPANAAETAAIEQTKLSIRELNRDLTNAKSAKPVKLAAAAALKGIAEQEYARPDGGRDPVKRILARYGYGNPKK
jgi:hypothetical protein